MERLDFGRSFTFMFEDPDWIVKLIVGALIFLVGMVFSIVLIGLLALLVLAGYMVAIVRQVARGNELPLPAWQDFGAILMDGLRVSVALFVWSLPTLILYLPILVLSLFSSSGGDMSNAASAMLAVVLLVCGCLMLLYSIFLAIVSPIVILQVAEEESIAAGFNFSRIFTLLREHLGTVVLVAIGIVVAQALAGLVGALLCGVGVLITGVWALWVEGHLIGQLGRLASSSPYPDVVTP